MSYANDILKAANRRGLDLTHNTAIEVYEPMVEYVQGEGYTTTYPDTPSATYEARSEEPQASADKDESGTTAEIDREIMVRDDTDQQWVGYGESGDAPVRIRDLGDGTLYEVQTVTNAHDGRITLEAVNV